jgi:hypothetical protein
MPQPLELGYNWRLPAIAWTVGAVAVLFLLILRHPPGWLPVALFILVLWALFVGLVYLRARAYLEVDGSRLTVRRFRDKHTVEGSDVVRVTEFLTSRGPCHRLTVAQGGTGGSSPSEPALTRDRRTVRYTVPTALLRTGHSTFFSWLLAHAPQAELDKSTRKTLDQLRRRGLLE